MVNRCSSLGRLGREGPNSSLLNSSSRLSFPSLWSPSTVSHRDDDHRQSEVLDASAVRPSPVRLTNTMRGKGARLRGQLGQGYRKWLCVQSNTRLVLLYQKRAEQTNAQPRKCLMDYWQRICLAPCDGCALSRVLYPGHVGKLESWQQSASHPASYAGSARSISEYGDFLRGRGAGFSGAAMPLPITATAWVPLSIAQARPSSHRCLRA